MAHSGNFFVIFSIPKSAGQALASALDLGCPAAARGKRIPVSMSTKDGLHAVLPLRAEHLNDFPDGGWLHYHAPASFPTLQILGEFDLKYLVVVRHPADQLPAYWCHVRKHWAIEPPAPIKGHPDWIYAVPMAPHVRRYVEPSADVDEGLAHLIGDGYLFAVLQWMADWCVYRVPERSQVVRYEDYVRERRGTLKSIAQFLAPAVSFDDDAFNTAERALDQYRDGSLGWAPDWAYPRGYTGDIGIYRQYLSPKNFDAYRCVTSTFLKSYPGADQVLELYPDLIP